MEESNHATESIPCLLKHISLIKSSNQLKWKSDNQTLTTFLSKRLDINIDDIKVNSNGSCSTFKMANLTVNFYHSTKTLHIQGKSSVEFRRLLVEELNNTNDDSTDYETPNSVSQVEILSENETDSEEDESEDDSEGDGEQAVDTGANFTKELHKIWTEIDKINKVIKRQDTSKDKCSTLEFELAVMKSKCSEHEMTIENLMKERISLLETIKILSTTTVPNDPNSLLSTAVSNESNVKTGKKKTAKKKSMASSKESRINITQNPQNIDSDSANRRTKSSIVIAGDSMLKYIDGRKLSHKASTYVKTFPGAKGEDMKDYIRPSLRRKPNEIILHIGTNNIKTEDPKSIAEQISELGKFIQSDSPETKVTISALITRSDDVRLDNKIKKVNETLNRLVKQNNWKILSNSNIRPEHLNSGGLHLNAQGIKILASNLISHIKQE